MFHPFKYLYGPVHSWRLGLSLGVDPLSTQSKTCNMNCTYCQLGNTTQMTCQRKEYIKTKDLMEEINRIPLHFVDYITFSGRGEPTLARNLGQMISAVKKVRHEHVAVITNGLLMSDKGVRSELMQADFVLAKLDAGNAEDFADISGCPAGDFEGMINGLCDFRRDFNGKLALQVMVLNRNSGQMEAVSKLARRIKPNEVELNTPLRPCAEAAVQPLQIDWAKNFFNGLPVVGVYDKPKVAFKPWDESATARRHGNWRKTKDY